MTIIITFTIDVATVFVVDNGNDDEIGVIGDMMSFAVVTAVV